MAKDHLGRCIWIVETIKAHPKGITLKQLSALWEADQICDGKPLPRRSFISYKKQIFDLFSIDIKCHPRTFEYTIEQTGIEASVSDWIMEATSTSSAIQGARDIADRIVLEKVPSAGDNLRAMLDAIKERRPATFMYHAYTRTEAKEVKIEPYFVKIFKQRWYVVGRNIDDGKIKTYALDRMSAPRSIDGRVRMPRAMDPATYFDHAFGIVVDHTLPQTVKIKCGPMQAKYLRALPLHSSQTEEVADDHSIFTYRLLLTADLRTELLSYGSRIEVLEPPELRTALADELRAALAAYQ